MIELQPWVDELSGLVPDVLLPEEIAEASFELTQSRYIAYVHGDAALLATNYYISDIYKVGDNYLFCWIPNKRID